MYYGKAKCKFDNEWIYGAIVPTYGGVYIIDLGPQRIDGNRIWAECDPDTLSRCSGLIACGQDVYEGDIIRFHIDHTTEFWTAVVRFGWHDTYEYGWYLEPIRDTVFTKRIGAWLGENPAFGSTAAVIGNVWDNPEMLGVQT